MYAESRIGLAVHRAADRLSFVSVRLKTQDNSAPESRAQCQAEAWIRGLGLVTAQYADADSYAAIDRAAALLEQAVLRKLRQANVPDAEEQELYAALSSD
jgi:ribosome-associated translation inhibitor RaiA